MSPPPFPGEEVRLWIKVIFLGHTSKKQWLPVQPVLPEGAGARALLLADPTSTE